MTATISLWSCRAWVRLMWPSGYEATVLPELCEAVISAEQAGALTTEQELRYAKQCPSGIAPPSLRKGRYRALVEMRQRAFEDELEPRYYLAQIFQAFIAKELRAVDADIP